MVLLYKFIVPIGANTLDNVYMGMAVATESMVMHFVVPTSWWWLNVVGITGVGLAPSTFCFLGYS